MQPTPLQSKLDSLNITLDTFAHFAQTAGINIRTTKDLLNGQGSLTTERITKALTALGINPSELQKETDEWREGVRNDLISQANNKSKLTVPRNLSKADTDRLIADFEYGAEILQYVHDSQYLLHEIRDILPKIELILTEYKRLAYDIHPDIDIENHIDYKMKLSDLCKTYQVSDAQAMEWIGNNEVRHQEINGEIYCDLKSFVYRCYGRMVICHVCSKRWWTQRGRGKRRDFVKNFIYDCCSQKCKAEHRAGYKRLRMRAEAEIKRRLDEKLSLDDPPIIVEF